MNLPPMMAFQLHTSVGTTTSMPQRSIAVSPVSISHAPTRIAFGAGEAALCMNVLADALETYEVVAATVTVKGVTQQLSWLDDVYALVRQSKTDAAVDVLLARFDEVLSKSEFQKSDSVLRSLDLNRLDITTMLTVLSATRPARAHLKARDEVVRGVEKALQELVPDRAHRLLENLR